MSSELRVNVLRGSSANGNITIQGEGTSNLGGATMQLQQGLSKAWANINGTAATPVYRDSFNCSSLTDNTGGVYAPQLTNVMSNGDFCQVASAHHNGVSYSASPYTGAKTTNQMGLSCGKLNGSPADAQTIDTSAHGDLA